MRSVTGGEPPDDRLAWDHDLCRAVVGRTMRAILGFLRRRARDAGVTDGRGGAVAILQRFGGALNLNVHIHALVVDGVFADQRDRLERIARYALRPPVAQDRLAWTDAGQVRLELRRSWSDGTTHLLFDPVELLERLAALTPRPRVNLILYHGVLAPRAAWRARVVQFGAADGPDATQADNDPEPRPDPAGCSHGCNYLWAELMRRSLGLDVLACPRCGGRLTLIALIDDPAVIGRMLQHLKLPTEVPEARPARAPPALLLDGAPRSDAPDEFCVDDPA